MAFHPLYNVKYAMINLVAFEEALLWASPSYEWCGDVDIETFRRQKNCIKELFCEFGGFPNLIVMVGAPRGHVSWSKLRVVDAEDPALCEIGAKEGPDRCLSAFRSYKTLFERFRRLFDDYLNADNSGNGDHLASVTVLELPWWVRAAPKLSFAFQKPCLRDKLM
ncbi:hypothetical protein KVR01_006173 [Diaporthe batatas]|uniref:uncharacterized protein n=1 Tax=Diaporthe batatas TaxID=748121 RepID=UPI001D0548B5|nr:uncharacterized protein KVR01_006173 [Diaporthe batatas]KAG8164255.1 hypothetical protein KVR01_006173 [Diaporthe batatas]